MSDGDDSFDNGLYGSLTQREREILQLLAEHLSDREIAERLFIANTTVRWFNRQIFNKLNVGNRKEAIIRARQLGLLDHAPTHVAPIKVRLPHDTTAFIDRHIETAKIVEILGSTSCHLLTLIGTGGIGKTRLALRAAYKLAESQFDSVVFVSLVGVAAAEYLPATLATALSFTFHMGEDEETQLLNYLSSKRLLLVIDNYEHLLPDVDLLVKILQHAPNVKLLITSRERLKVQEEWLFEVNGLPYTSAYMQAEEQPHALQLFVERATQINPHFRCDGNEQAAVLEICRQVQGAPLAIELAAGWARSLAASEIATAIREPFRLLTTRLQNVPERHRSLETVFEQTWVRLTEREQHVLMVLSVFRGGFTREAAEVVARVDFEMLAALQDKSLLARQETGRYELHELIRQFAEAKLKLEPEQEHEARQRHSQHFAQLLWVQTRILISDQSQTAMTQLGNDIENIRIAWKWMITNSDLASFEQSWEAVWLFFYSTNRCHEGKTIFAYAAQQLQSSTDTRDQQRATVIAISASAWFSLHDWKDIR
jgi:predicted ATPase/DNA-binding CsgD family transcriptional regulator